MTKTPKAEFVYDIALAQGFKSISPQALFAQVRDRTKVKTKAVSYDYKPGVFVGPPYDLGEIARAADTDSYILQSIRKHREAILKDGWLLLGEDATFVEYIKERLFMFYMFTGISPDQWIRECLTNLVRYGTFMLHLRRDNSGRTPGKEIKWNGRTLKPIAGVFPLDPSTMLVKTQKSGLPEKWMQRVRVNDTYYETEFEPDDVLIGTIDKSTGFTFGTPYILPVLDDVFFLRNLEQIVQLIAQRCGVPREKWTVGTEDKPAKEFDDGTSELDLLAARVSEMPSVGPVVTTERINVETLKISDSVVDLLPYINYFEGRVLQGLRLSPIDLGQSQGSSRGSAVQISKSLLDSAKDMQTAFSSAITYGLMIPLLLEGGKDVTHTNLVKFAFPAIDQEEMLAKQNHGIQLFSMNGVTRTEFRKDYLDKQAMTEEEAADTLLEIEHEKAVELAKLSGAIKAATATGKSTSGAAKQTANKARPKNQHGTKSTKTRITANAVEAYTNRLRDHVKHVRKSLIDNWLNEDLVDPFIHNLFQTAIDFCVKEANLYINDAIKLGISELINDGSYALSNRARDKFYKNYIRKSFERMFTPVEMELIESLHLRQSKVDAAAILDRLPADLLLVGSTQLDTSYKFGYVKAARHLGYSYVNVGERRVFIKPRALPYAQLISLGEDISLEPEVSLES